MNKTVRFKDEIRKSFISYALIPCIIFVFLIVIGSFAIWSVGIYSNLKNENEILHTLLETTLDQYTLQIEKMTSTQAEHDGLSVFNMKTDANAAATAYADLKQFILNQTIQATFIVLDSDLQIVLEDDIFDSFRLPDYHKNFDWATLGRIKESPSETHIEVTKEYSSGNLNEMIIGRAIHSTDSKIIDGFLLFIISEAEILEKTNMISSPFIITNQYGKNFACSSRYYLTSFGKLAQKYRIPDKAIYVSGKDAVFQQAVHNDVLFVYTINNISQLQTAMLTILVMVAAFLLLLTWGMIVTASKIAKQKTKIIDEIVAAYAGVEQGILDKRLHIDTNIEFQTIADAHNKMLDDIKDLIRVNKKEAKAKYLSELKQLEMQFNPHFLFNTLEIIKYLTKLDPDMAQETIVRLSEILRYSIDSELSLVPLAQDITHIENYLFILKSRFQKRFEYSITVDEAVKNVLIPKLIIQPIIENSVKYGLDSVQHITLAMTAIIEGDKLVITVADSGDGIDKTKLFQLRKLVQSKNNNTNHTGLYNVQRRIQLMFGAQYGIDIKSTKGTGTRVKIIMPYKYVVRGSQKHSKKIPYLG